MLVPTFHFEGKNSTSTSTKIYCIEPEGEGEEEGGLAVVTADILGVIVVALSDAPAPGVGQAPPAAPTGPTDQEYGGR